VLAAQAGQLRGVGDVGEAVRRGWATRWSSQRLCILTSMLPALKVATLNLYGPPYRAEERAELVVKGLARLRPDIVGLQEVNIGADIGNRIYTGLGLLVEATTFRILHVANPGKEVHRGALGVITHLPVLAHDATDYLTSGLEWNRTAQRVRVDVGGQHLDFYNTHFHFQLGPEADETRCEQVERLLAWMDSHGWDFKGARRRFQRLA